MRHILPYMCIIIILLADAVQADGLLRPVNPDYPVEFLRNRATSVYVRLNGQIAETAVYQEFVNEWNQPVDAVYSFPLPPDARATAFFYWRNDTLYKAILKVKEQAVNPGTGQGGIVAYLNEYIGRNGIKISLKGIPAGGIQKVQLHYISLSDYYNGTMTYRYPLETQQFITYPLELFDVEIDLFANQPIQSASILSHSGSTYLQPSDRHIKLTMHQSKTYLTKDMVLQYTIPNDSLNIDFYSSANDTMDGHFVLFLKPDETVAPADVLNKRIVFLLDCSSSMRGYRLEQSIKAISQCLDQLGAGDAFNIVTFHNTVQSWQQQPVAATRENVQAAQQFLTTLSTHYGNFLGTALKQCLGQFTNQETVNSIFLFTDGFSIIDPMEIQTSNSHRTGIFCVAIGNEIDRAKLEMLSRLNYGFVTYMDDTDNLPAGITRVYHQISQPLLMDTRLEFGLSNVYDVLPETFPTIYEGFRFFLTGRYSTPGKSAFSIAGQSVQGTQAYDYRLDFATVATPNHFAERIWAKEKIDAIERQIAVYGETDSLRQLDIDISLKYNIRCKYTAYIADYENMATSLRPVVEEIPTPQQSMIIANYPNPFNASTNIRFFLGDDATHIGRKFIRIYNLIGQLIAVIDISHLKPGMHTITFHGRDMFGNELPSGVYFCRLIVGDHISTIRLNYVK